MRGRSRVNCPLRGVRCSLWRVSSASLIPEAEALLGDARCSLARWFFDVAFAHCVLDTMAPAEIGHVQRPAQIVMEHTGKDEEDMVKNTVIHFL